MLFTIFGDSICVGQHINPYETWVSELSRRVHSFGSRGLLLQNASINGNTSRQALERLSYEVLSQNPDAVYVQFGMNDANFWETDRGLPRVLPKTFSANLHEIIERLVNSGTRLIVIATNHPSHRRLKTGESDTRYNANNLMYNQAVREVYAYVKDVQGLINVEILDNERWWMEHLDSTNKYLLDDGVHLSQLGHLAYTMHAVPPLLFFLEKHLLRQDD
jgi:lysophospholipase L1-like esterase